MPSKRLVAAFYLLAVLESASNPNVSMAQAVRAVNILSIDDAAGASRVVSIPVDSTLSRLTVDADYPAFDSYVVTLLRPDASMVLVTDPGVIVESSPTKTYISVNNPTQGTWKVDLSGGGAVNLFVGGLSTLDLESCGFVRAEGRPGHGGFIPVPGEPLASQPNFVLAATTDGTSTANFDFRNTTGHFLEAISLTRLTRSGRNYFFGQVTPPSGRFICYITGLNQAGQAYQRMAPRVFSSQTLIVEPPPPQDLVPGFPAKFQFAVTNVGPSDVITMSGSDSKGFFQSVTPSLATLASNETINVDVLLNVPTSAVAGSSDVIKLNALGTGGSKNYAAVRSAVFMRTTVSVPSVEGLSHSAALAALEGVGLLIGKESEASATSAVGTVLSQNPSAGTVVPTDTPVDLTIAKRATVLGDLDSDGDVDKNDINLVLAAKGTAASGPSDPRDIDKDGQITILDARKLTLMCTRPNCAP